MHTCLDFVEPFLWNVDRRCRKLFCFEGNLIRALLNSLNGRAHTKTAIACACMHGFGSNFVCKLIGPIRNFFIFLTNWIRALLNWFFGGGTIRDEGGGEGEGQNTILRLDAQADNNIVYLFYLVTKHLNNAMHNSIKSPVGEYFHFFIMALLYAMGPKAL